MEEEANSVSEQLERYGQVECVDKSKGIFVDPANNIWTWEVAFGTVTFTKPGWRTRTVDLVNVSRYMFYWLYDDEDCKGSLEFTLETKEVVKFFGRRGAHEAFVRGGRSVVSRPKRQANHTVGMGRAVRGS
jgi:hypothetical protein